MSAGKTFVNTTPEKGGRGDDESEPNTPNSLLFSPCSEANNPAAAFRDNQGYLRRSNDFTSSSSLGPKATTNRLSMPSHPSSSMSGNSSAHAKRALLRHLDSDLDTDILTVTNVDNYKVAFVDIFSWKQKKDDHSSKYIVYIIHVTSRSGLRWTVEKRYQQFRDFRKIINSNYPDLADIPFPGKKWLFNMSEFNLKKRQVGLRDYLQTLLSVDPVPEEIADFLDVQQSVASLFDDRRSLSISSIVSSLSVHDFKLVKVLGKGSFGKVYLVRPITSNLIINNESDVFAMKVLKKSEVVKRHQVDHTNAERLIMEKIRHPFILSLRYAFQTKQKLYMITDYCAGGEIFFHLKKMHR